MFRCVCCAVLLTALIACSPAGDDRPSAAVDTAAAPGGAKLAGQDAYERVCAGCHQDGLNGAPAVGDREAWAARSSLWVGVLEEHAKSGYLAMPARGGDPAASDREVAAAAEYMLTLTHPDLPPE
jgi:cytochrome c5